MFYLYVVDNIWEEMSRRKLKEITDYVADTLANLYFLVNSTNIDITIEKTLNLPLEVGDSGYYIKILQDQNNTATGVRAYFQGKSWLNVTSWLSPGLKVDTYQNQDQLQSSGKTVVAGCSRVSSNVYVWIAYKNG